MYLDKWNWIELSFNSGLPWSSDFISKYMDKWDLYNLFRNESIVWTEEMINSIKNNDSWHFILYNKTAPLKLDDFIENQKKYRLGIPILDNMQQYIIPFIDDSLIEEIINETITHSIGRSLVK